MKDFCYQVAYREQGQRRVRRVCWKNARVLDVQSAQAALQGDDGFFQESPSSRQGEGGKRWWSPSWEYLICIFMKELMVVEKQRKDRTAGARVEREFGKHLCSLPWQILMP